MDWYLFQVRNNDATLEFMAVCPRLKQIAGNFVSEFLEYRGTISCFFSSACAILFFLFETFEPYLAISYAFLFFLYELCNVSFAIVII